MMGEKIKEIEKWVLNEKEREVGNVNEIVEKVKKLEINGEKNDMELLRLNEALVKD